MECFVDHVGMNSWDYLFFDSCQLPVRRAEWESGAITQRGGMPYRASKGWNSFSSTKGRNVCECCGSNGRFTAMCEITNAMCVVRVARWCDPAIDSFVVRILIQTGLPGCDCPPRHHTTLKSQRPPSCPVSHTAGNSAVRMPVSTTTRPPHVSITGVSVTRPRSTQPRSTQPRYLLPPTLPNIPSVSLPSALSDPQLVRPINSPTNTHRNKDGRT